MRKIVLIALVLIVSMTYSFGQESNSGIKPKNNAVFVEAGGAAAWYSINYERKFMLKPMHRVTAGVGTSIIPAGDTALFTGLLAAGYLYGCKHNLELGLAGAYEFSGPEFIASARIGYRYEGPKGLQFRVGFSPIYGQIAAPVEDYSGKGVLPWGYVSLGFTF